MATLDLTSAASEGFGAATEAKCPYCWSSPNWLAWHVGQWLRQAGRERPKHVRPGRGHLIRADEMIFRVDTSNGRVVQQS